MRLPFGSMLSLAALLAAPALLAAQQPAVISGAVIREDGEPLPGATVAIPSIGFGTTTRADGRYVLTVPGNRVQGQQVELSVRAIGYKPVTRDITLAEGESAQDFSLESNPLQLGELVVTGAGTVSEVEKLTSVRNNVDSSLIARSNEGNLISALAAKAPNVQVISNAGDPGTSTSIQIRGANTLAGTSEPLFVVDGQPIDNSTIATAQFDGTIFGSQQGTYAPNRAVDLNPGDIESIEILKGAAAGSIYGARAGQGVVLITTKRGRPGQTRYSLRSSFSVNDVNRFPELQRRYGQGEGGIAETCVPSSDPALLDCEGTTRSWGPEVPDGVGTFDHARDMFETGWASDNTLTISGGNERTTFFVSGALLNQEGTFVGPNNNFNRKSFRLNADHGLTDRLKIGGNVSYASSRGNFLQKGSNFSGVLFGAWRSTPTFDNSQYTDPVNGMHRSYAFPNPSANSFDLPRGYDNPFWVANTNLGQSFADRAIGNLNASWRPRDWLNISYTIGVDYSGDDRLQGQPQTTSNSPSALGQVIKVDITNIQFDHNLTATASYKAAKNLAGTFTLGQNLNTRSIRQVGGVGDALLAPAPFSLLNTAARQPIDSQAKVRTEGYFGQATLDVAEQLFIKAGLRYDGASVYSEDELRSWFPSLSAAWQFSKPLGESKLISYGKIRAAYGEVGTQPAAYLPATIFQAGGLFGDPFGPSQIIPGSLNTPINRPATGLKPERSKEIEAGFDIGLFGDLADLSFTWYRKTSTDVILPVNVAASTGYQLQFANAAEIRNAGTEWSLNVRPITRRNFAWDVGLIFATNRNRVNDLEGATFVAYGGTGAFGLSVAQVGEPIAAFLDYDYVRCGRGIVLADGGGNDYSVDDNCSPEQNASNALFLTDGTLSVPASGDLGLGAGYPLLDPERRIIGDPQPDWTGSVRTGLRFGNFSVSGLVDVRKGGLVYNGTRGALNELGTGIETLRRGEAATLGQDFLEGPVAGPGAGTQVVLSEDFIRNYYTTFILLGQPFYESGTFVKLREISLGYTLQNSGLTRSLGLSSIDLRLAGRNLAVWTDYTGIDPETNLGGAETGARGVDWFNHPQTRSYVFSVTLNR
jgi:TonB-linked SusC/RagA family outer membrane protein